MLLAFVVAALCCQLLPMAAGNSEHTKLPRWYVLTEEDFPEEHRDHPIARENIKTVDDVAQNGRNCIGAVNGNTEPEFFMSYDLQWSCVMLHRLMGSPLRTYDMEEADFVVVPAPLPADLDDNKVDLDYFRSAELLFPHRKQVPHLLFLRWQFPKQIRVIERAPDVAAQFFYMVQQYPVYFQYGYDSWWNAQHWRYDADAHPGVKALRYNIVGVPWLAMTKWTMGSRHFHQPLDVEELKQRKTLPLKGYYQVRTPQREYLHKQCNKETFCQSINIWDFPSTDPRHYQFLSAYDKAWVAIQAQGDEVTRTAMLDVWCHDTGNLFLAEPEWIIPYFPFADMIDYRGLAYYIKHIDRAIKDKDDHYLKDFESQFSVEKTIDMIQAARNVSHVFQYMQWPFDLAIRFEDLQEMHRFDDAYTFSIKALLRQLCNAGRIDAKRCGGKLPFKPIHDGIVGPQHLDL